MESNPVSIGGDFSRLSNEEIIKNRVQLIEKVQQKVSDAIGQLEADRNFSVQEDVRSILVCVRKDLELIKASCRDEGTMNT